MTPEEYIAKVALAIKLEKAYYGGEGKALATDDEYDVIRGELKVFEKANPEQALPASPSFRVGTPVAEGFKKGKHIKKMYSMEDVFDEAGAIKFLSNFPAGTMFECEPKFDGASLNLRYDKGLLVKAITRGDGEEGEDVTANVVFIQGIPTSIEYKGLLEIRGEVTIHTADFEKVNEARVRFGKDEFSNQRNAASGALRSLESKHIKEYGLKFSPYSFGENELDFELQSQEMAWAFEQGFKDWGVKVSQTASSIDEVMEIYKKMVAERSNYPMMLDGLVIKAQSKALQEEMGETSKSPRWCIAFKFPALEKTTRLIGVTLSTGKSGIISPVGHIEPTNLDGALVKKVFLHNFDEIKKKGYMIGDYVSIIRSGDVIPKLTGVFEDRRDGTEQEIVRPVVCPSCGSSDLDNSSVHIKCVNPDCSSKVKGIISYAVGKRALDISGIGESTVSELVDKGFVKTVGDLWRVSMTDFLSLEGFSAKKAENAYKGIQATIGTTEAHRVLNSVEIEGLGRSASKKIIEHFRERVFDPIENPISFDEMLNVEDMGEERARSFVNFMAEFGHQVVDIAESIKPLFLEEVVLGNALEGKVFVITGTLSQSRGYFKELIEGHGGKVSGSVSKKTDYLLAGAAAGSKAAKAESLGVAILDEEAFMKMVA